MGSLSLCGLRKKKALYTQHSLLCSGCVLYPGKTQVLCEVQAKYRQENGEENQLCVDTFKHCISAQRFLDAPQIRSVHFSIAFQ